MFLLSLIDACCLVLVMASLRACVAGCCHLLWHFFCVCSYACCLSPRLRHLLEFPRSFPNTKRKERSHAQPPQKQTNLAQARVSQRSPSESKASFSADLRSPCHTPFSKNIRQHHVEHHHQTPSISIQHLLQAETEGARSTTINEGPHAATRSTPWDSQLRGLPLAIACRMSSARKQGRKEIM